MGPERFRSWRLRSTDNATLVVRVTGKKNCHLHDRIPFTGKCQFPFGGILLLPLPTEANIGETAVFSYPSFQRHHVFASRGDVDDPFPVDEHLVLHSRAGFDVSLAVTEGDFGSG